MLRNTLLALLTLAAPLLSTACGGAPESARTPAEATAAAPAPAAAAVATTGRVIEVKMITDDRGNYFEPSKIEAHRGDVVRFVLVSGVHNVSFPAAENAGKGGLPEPSDYLQLPGQSYDLVVSLAPGHYTFQCDPHAALGMVGTLEVERD